MERFDPDFICNASDDGGRYTYAKQPEICKWNLGKFAEAIGAAVPIAETKEILEREYDATFRQHYRTLMANKLGLTDMMEGEEVSNLDDLIASLFDTMKQTGADFTNTFGVLSEIPYSSVTENYDVERRKALEQLLAQCCSVEDLKRSLRYLMWNKRPQNHLTNECKTEHVQLSPSPQYFLNHRATYFFCLR